MVGLSVVALAKGDSVPPDRVMTGAVTPDGHIAPVGSVSLKVRAAEQAHMRRIVVPDETDPADADWRTPFLLQVSPVASVEQAYLALTDRTLLSERTGADVVSPWCRWIPLHHGGIPPPSAVFSGGSLLVTLESRSGGSLSIPDVLPKR